MVFFNYKSCGFGFLDHTFSSIDWNVVFGSGDATTCFSEFRKTIFDFCKMYIPVLSKRSHKFPWYSKELKRLKNLRNKFFKKFKRTNDNGHFESFTSFRDQFNALNRSCYRGYVSNFESNIIDNPKCFWNYIKSMKGVSSVPASVFYKNATAASLNEAANLFADFFASNFVSDDETDLSVMDDVADTVEGASFNVGALILSDEDILDGVKNLKYSCHTDDDGFSAILLKNCLSLVEPLKLIFNKSLSSGIFIEQWKHTSITPLFKSGNKSDVSNYRPISKLTTISKLFEGIVKNRLFYILPRVICPYQHGFVAGRSTVTNLAVFTDDCIKCFQAGYQVDTIYTDFSKAFDRISHKILIYKLSQLGFHSTFLQWIKTYLSHRTSSVVLDGVSSMMFSITSGVPQGSILGPLFFLLFINDIGSCFSTSKYLLYADDLKIYSCIRSVNDSLLLQADIDRLQLWCVKNRLFLNVKKCNQITFSKQSTPLFTSYHISDTRLECLKEAKDLGVFFDSKFTFVTHINYTVAKSFAMLAFVRRNSSAFSNPYTHKVLYSAFVRSRLEYAAFIWRPYYQVHINRIESVQRVFIRHALKSLNFSDPVPSYSSRCQLINLMSLHNRRIFLSISFVFDIITGNIDCPSLLSRIFFNVPSRVLRHVDLFRIAISRTLYSQNAPLNRTLIEINTISSFLEIDFSRSKDFFRNNLKCYLSNVSSIY